MKCGSCGAEGKRHWGRGLCQLCHQRAARSGTLIDVPRSTVDRDSMIEEALFFIEGCSTVRPDLLANAVGMSNDALTLALRRAARAGDERAITIRERLTGVRP